MILQHPMHFLIASHWKEQESYFTRANYSTTLKDGVVLLVVITDWLLSTREALEATGLPADAFSRALVRPVQPFNAAVVLAVFALAGLFVSYRRIVTFSRSAANV